MDKLHRLGRLQRLVQAADGPIDGRKKLHKLAYLCQRKGTDLGQTFQFHMYGVYSSSLARDVGAAKAWNLLQEVPVGGGSYEIFLHRDPLPTEFQSAADEAGYRTVQELAGQAPTTLEVLSTVVYLWDLGFRGGDLKESLLGVKGHLQFRFGDAFALADKHFGIGIK